MGAFKSGKCSSLEELCLAKINCKDVAVWNVTLVSVYAMGVTRGVSFQSTYLQLLKSARLRIQSKLHSHFPPIIKIWSHYGCVPFQLIAKYVFLLSS